MKDRRFAGLIRPHSAKLKLLQRFWDSAVIGIALWFALWLAGYVKSSDNIWSEIYQSYIFGAILLYQFFADYYELHYAWRGTPLHEELLRLLWTWLCTMGTLLVISFVFKWSSQASRLVIAYWFIATSVGLGLTLVMVRQLLGFIRSKGRNSRKVAIIGANELGERFGATLESMSWLGYRLVGYYDDRAFSEGRRIDGSNGVIRGTLDDAISHAQEGEVDEIFIALPMRAERRVIQLLDKLSDTTAVVYYIPDLFVFNLVHSRINLIQGIPFVSVFDSPFKTHPIDKAIKRLEDIVLAVLILTVALIPMFLIAIGIKLTSSGPALFRQKRYGAGGGIIEVWKFRTMNVEENGHIIHQATRNDKRITPFGAFLRKYSLDELPQLFNVLQGSMSIVGPRPHAVAHNEYYRKQVSAYMLRHTVKPGITGLAQVRGCRGETDTIEKMETRVLHDLEYINRWGVLLDLKILFLTLFKVWHDPNAY